MEQRDLYDINRKLTGEKIFKGEPIPEGKYIIVVLAFIQNSKNELLIQKRSANKDGKYGGTGGHPKSGETSLQGMITEIKEEIGLDVNPEELELIFSGREDSTHVFYDLYYMKKDLEISNLTLQKEEVDFVKWMPINDVLKIIENGDFLKNHEDEVFRFIKIFEERGIYFNN